MMVSPLEKKGEELRKEKEEKRERKEVGI